MVPQHAYSFGKYSIEIIGEHRQVVETALHDKDIFAGTLKWELPAIPDEDLAWPCILGGKGRRQIDSFDLIEAKLVKRPEATPSSAKQLHYLCISPPFRGIHKF